MTPAGVPHPPRQRARRAWFDRPDPARGRDLLCTRCDQLITVHELPTEFLEPASYVCGECHAAHAVADGLAAA